MYCFLLDTQISCDDAIYNAIYLLHQHTGLEHTWLQVQILVKWNYYFKYAAYIIIIIIIIIISRMNGCSSSIYCILG